LELIDDIFPDNTHLKKLQGIEIDHSIINKILYYIDYFRYIKYNFTKFSEIIMGFRMLNIAIIIPCFNEEITIQKVIQDFKQIELNLSIYVFDNNCTDNTAQIAKQSGVTVVHSPHQGKGSVINHAFSIINADVYIIADGDDQCDTSVIPDAVRKLTTEHLDMLTLVRIPKNKSTYRLGHMFGNKVLTKLTHIFFKNTCSDVLGGYRVFSKAFVKSFPGHSRGFEIEIELSVFASQMRLRTGEMFVSYRARPKGSVSKLHTIRDGIRILLTIFYLLIAEQPLRVFSILAIIIGSFGTYGIIYSSKFFTDFTSLQYIPTAIFYSIFFIIAILLFIAGLLMYYIQRNTIEQRRFTYNYFSLSEK